MTASRALALSRTPKKPHTLADPQPVNPADELAPASVAPAPAAPAPEGSAGAQELLCWMKTVQWYAELEVQCDFRLNFICGSEDSELDNLTNL